MQYQRLVHRCWQSHLANQEVSRALGVASGQDRALHELIPKARPAHQMRGFPEQTRARRASPAMVGMHATSLTSPNPSYSFVILNPEPHSELGFEGLFRLKPATGPLPHTMDPRSAWSPSPPPMPQHQHPPTSQCVARPGL